MIFNRVTRTVIGVILSLVILVGLIWFLYTIEKIIVYVLISVVLALVGRPIMKLLDKVKIGKWKLPCSVQALITLALMVGTLIGFVSIFVPLVAEEARIISSIDPETVAKSLEEPIGHFETWLEQYDIGANPNESNRKFIERRLSGLIDVTRISDIFNRLIGTLGNISAALFSIFFITFFLLKERNLASNAVEAITPDRYLERVKSVLTNTKKTLTRYFTGLLIQIIIVTTLLTIGLSVLGIKNALVIGFFGGLVNIIPYLGPFIGAAFAIIIGLSSNLELDFYEGMLPLAGGIAGVFLAVQLLDNFLLQPIIFSNSVNVHPLEIFLVILIAGNLAGVTGMILAVPAYSFLRIIAKEFLSKFKLVRSLTKNMD